MFSFRSFKSLAIIAILLVILFSVLIRVVMLSKDDDAVLKKIAIQKTYPELCVQALSSTVESNRYLEDSTISHLSYMPKQNEGPLVSCVIQVNEHRDDKGLLGLVTGYSGKTVYFVTIFKSGGLFSIYNLTDANQNKANEWQPVVPSMEEITRSMEDLKQSSVVVGEQQVKLQKEINQIELDLLKIKNEVEALKNEL